MYDNTAMAPTAGGPADEQDIGFPGSWQGRAAGIAKNLWNAVYTPIQGTTDYFNPNVSEFTEAQRALRNMDGGVGGAAEANAKYPPAVRMTLTVIGIVAAVLLVKWLLPMVFWGIIFGAVALGILAIYHNAQTKNRSANWERHPIDNYYP